MTYFHGCQGLETDSIGHFLDAYSHFELTSQDDFSFLGVFNPFVNKGDGEFRRKFFLNFIFYMVLTTKQTKLWFKKKRY